MVGGVGERVFESVRHKNVTQSAGGRDVICMLITVSLYEI